MSKPKPAHPAKSRSRAPSEAPRSSSPPSASASPSPSPSASAPPSIPRWLDSYGRHGLWIVLGAAVVVRFAYWMAVRANDPVYAQTLQGFDMHTYWTWGRQIAAGDLLGKEFTYNGPYYYGPLYAYFLAAVFKIFGESYDVVHGLQALGGLLPPVLMFLTARRLFGAGAALIAGMLAVFCAPILFYEQQLLMEGLLVAIHAAVLWALIRGQDAGRRAWMWAALAGVLSAVACWGRGNFLLAMPLLALTWLVAPVVQRWSLEPGEEGTEATPSPEPEETKAARARNKGRRGNARDKRKRQWTTGAVCAVAFGVGAAVFLAVPLARNLVVSKQFVLTTSNGPINFYIGNAHDSPGVFGYPASFHALVNQYTTQNKVPWRRELRRDIAEHPGAFARLMLRKTGMFWNSYHSADNTCYYINKRFSRLLRWNPVTWTTLVALALLGIWSTRRTWRRQLFLYVYAFGFAASIIVVFVAGRFKIQELLPMTVWSGAAVVALARHARAKRWNAVVLQALVFAGVVVVLWPTRSPATRFNAPPKLADKLPGHARLYRPNDFTNMAIAFNRKQRRQESIEVLEYGIEQHPWFDPLVTRLAHAYIEDERYELALFHLERCREFSGENKNVLMMLADTLVRLGRYEEARPPLESARRLDPNDPNIPVLLENLPSKR